MRTSLAGKTALITGGGSGIGQALAIEADRRGMAIALVGRREEMLEETRARLDSRSRCLIMPGDVTSNETRQLVRSRLAREWGYLHFLVNNAGIIAAGPLATMGDTKLNQLISTNLTAPIALTREMLPLLHAGAPARVVNIGSLLGEIAVPMFAAYSSSKFGLRGLSNALRRELKSLGIGVTHVAARGAETDATQAIASFVEPFKIKLDSAEAIARQVWDAAARGQRSVYPGGNQRFLALIERFAPALVDRVLATQLESSGMRLLIEESAPVCPPKINSINSLPDPN